MDHYVKVHENPQGPGDGRTTAEQVLQDQGLSGRLTGKTVLITGGTAGLGKESARILHKTGAKIFITGRTQSRGDEVAREISSSDPTLPSIEAIEMDLGSFESVRSGAAAFLRRSEDLTILLENAGVMAPPEGQTAEGFETCFGINHLAHFLLFQLLLPALRKGSATDFQSRVVVLSSAGHRTSNVVPENYNLKGEYDPWVAYGQSKTCNILFASEIERRYGSEGVHGMSVHPGVIFETELSRHQGGGDQLEKSLVERTPELALIIKNIGQGAATQVWACIARELEGKGGFYLEDVQVSKPALKADRFNPGYAPYAYDEDIAKRLWTDSVGFIKGSA